MRKSRQTGRKPVDRSHNIEGRVRELEAAGLLRPAAKAGPMPPLSPRRLKGVPLARTVQEERDSR